MSGEAPPIMLIMAVTKIQKVHQSLLEVEQANRWMFNVGELRFWLYVGVGKEEKGKRTFSEEDVFLFPQSWCFNAASSKLEGV